MPQARIIVTDSDISLKITLADDEDVTAVLRDENCEIDVNDEVLDEAFSYIEGNLDTEEIYDLLYCKAISPLLHTWAILKSHENGGAREQIG